MSYKTGNLELHIGPPGLGAADNLETVIIDFIGKAKKELLRGKTHIRQEAFMRSSKKPGQNKHWKSWERLKKLVPADFNEAKYLSSNPDVAAAVKQGAMPSGAYHYAMYGMGKGCHASQDPSGRGKCDSKQRTFKGYRGRRPGYLSGIFSNWSQAGW